MWLTAFDVDQRLGPCAADGGAPHERCAEFVGQWAPLLQCIGSGVQLVDRRRATARHVDVRARLEVQPADPVRSRFQEVGDLVQVSGVGVASPGTVESFEVTRWPQESGPASRSAEAIDLLGLGVCHPARSGSSGV
jgi:hypothetical protein